MEFPARSKNNTEELFTWDEVRALLDKETMRRAEYIARILIEMKKRFGEESLEIARKVIYQIGYEKGTLRANIMQAEGKENNLENLAKLVSHKNAQLYLGNQVSICDEEMVVKEDYCPLPRKWKEMGMQDEQIISFCLLFDQVDKGMVEGYNHQFEAILSGCRGLAENGFCQMVVRNKG